jgi:hypothetical protein
VQAVTKAVRRVHEGTIGARSGEVARLHPPTLTLSLSLTTVELPFTNDVEDFANVTLLSCASAIQSPDCSTHSSVVSLATQQTGNSHCGVVYENLRLKREE